jgi:carbon-monoxide dehydrogenase medium subunit
MPPAVAFVQPHTLDDAVAALHHYGEDARPVAGATALTILLRQGLIRPAALVSLGGLPDLAAVERVNGSLRIGALATHRAVETSPLVRQMLPSLARTFAVVANVRVRNQATVGGVLAEADYASDPPTAFLALDATVHAIGPVGPRDLPISAFFQGFFQTALAPGEIVTGMSVPVPSPGLHGVYEKFVTRSSEDRPCLGAFAAVRLAADGRTCQELRVAVGAASETPQRYLDLEAQAVGQSLSEDVIGAIADDYADRVDTLADLRGSAWYRTEMIRVWVRRALRRAHTAATEQPA